MRFPLNRLGMVGHLAPVGDARQPVGRDVHRGHGSITIGERDVVRKLMGESAEHGDCGGDVVTYLEHVPNYQWHPKPVTDLAPSAERQRDRQTAVVDSVHQAPQAVPGAQDPTRTPAAPIDGRLEQSRIVVIVSKQHGLAGFAIANHGL